VNIVLNTEEANGVLALVSAHVLDHVELSEAGKQAIRDWRRDHSPGTIPLDAFAEHLNEALGNFIDERTRRMMRTRGSLKVQS
jgi:hypothetical protein